MAKILAPLLLAWLWFSPLITTFGEETITQECEYPYYALNTYRSAQTPVTIRFSCYSETSNCIIVHEKSTGEVEPVTELAPGSIEEVLLAPFYGDVLRSSGQFDVTFIEDNGGELAVRFPRGSDAGTLFAPAYYFPNTQNQDVFESCSIASLESASDVILYQNDVEARRISLNIMAISRISIPIFSSRKSISVRLEATNPVIVSCNSFSTITESAFYTWKPISSEPIFAYLDNGRVTITPTNCSTGEYIDDFESAVKLEYGGLGDGSCTQASSDTLSYSLLVSGTRCGVRAIAEENGICLSMLVQKRSSFVVLEMGWLTSTASTKLTTIPSDSPILAITKSTTTCQYENDSNRVNLDCEDNFEGSLSSSLCSRQTPVLTGGYVTVECSAPVFLYSTGTREFSLQNMGRQNLLVWGPVFEREGCSPPPTAPTSGPSPGPNPEPTPGSPVHPSSAMERASMSLCSTLLPLIALLLIAL